MSPPVVITQSLVNIVPTVVPSCLYASVVNVVPTVSVVPSCMYASIAMSPNIMFVCVCFKPLSHVRFTCTICPSPTVTTSTVCSIYVSDSPVIVHSLCSSTPCLLSNFSVKKDIPFLYLFLKDGFHSKYFLNCIYINFLSHISNRSFQVNIRFENIDTL